MLLHSFTSWLAFASVAFALPRAEPLDGDLLTRQDGECVNTPRTRQCWSNGYSIDTDFDAKQPPDGVEVKYNLVITNTTIPQPDGSPGTREVHLINGQYPGPLIRAKWGDTLVITVKNDMKDNGTGIHWHGLRQLNSCQHDGVPGVTECPIAPGKTRTYRFRATQFGTTWYHSHWSIQYGQGVVGPLIIDGPASSQYDEDLGALPLTDWYYQSAFMLNERAQNQGRPPTPDNLLVNGTHKNAAGGGTYAKISVVKGKKYRLRLINTSVDNYFTVSMDNHPFTVITSDFVPLRPYTAEQVTLAIGQRYDVVFSANQTSDNYWLRIQPGTQGNCGSNAILGKGIQPGAILHYSDATDAEPTKVAPLTLRTACQDEPLASLVPYVPNEVPQSVIGSAGKLDLNSLGAIQPNPATNTTARPFRWLIDGSPHIVDWNDPTLETILAGSEDFHNNSNVHPMQNDDGWYLWWIQTTTAIALPHPIHLHGHDFYILDAKAGATWDGTTTGLNLKNPPRRDTATLPAGGYLLMAFPADNPGMWIMHCHIAWHASQGLSMQFGERYDDIKSSLGDTSEFKKGCDEWDQFWVPGNHPYEQTDSGI